MKKEYLILGAIGIIGVYFLTKKKKGTKKAQSRDEFGMPRITNQHTGSSDTKTKLTKEEKEEKRLKCLNQVGLPSWYGDMSRGAKPTVMLDPNKIKAFHECNNN